MKIHSRDYRVGEGKEVDLDDWPTRTAEVYASEDDYQAILADRVRCLSAQQERLYAGGRYAVLLIFQAMDAAGKDGVIAHVMSGVNPQGCEVYSFKHPSPAELKHDFLWRTTVALPERGKIGIFNRSYYEEVLIARVHPGILRAENLPQFAGDDASIWAERYRSILGLERHLDRNGTCILKFFLHLSKDEQRKRFLARIDAPEKNWKFSEADVEERTYWKRYKKAYEKCLAATSTEHAPWYVVPADDKPNARLIVSSIVLETMQKLRLEFPATSPARRRELKRLRKRLAK